MLTDKVGYRTVLMLSTIGAGLCILITSLTTRFEVVLVAYGIFTGVLCYVAYTIIFSDCLCRNIYICIFTCIYINIHIYLFLILGSFMCFILIPTTVATANYFMKYKVLALTMSTCCYPLIYIVVGPVITKLIELYGWRMACTSMASVVMQVCVYYVVLLKN